MNKDMIELANPQTHPAEETNSLSQYLSFQFYNGNIDQLTGFTKDSINNFLKTITEIEDEFRTMMKGPQIKDQELHGFGFDHSEQYMEENY